MAKTALKIKWAGRGLTKDFIRLEQVRYGGGFHNKPKNLTEAQSAMGIDWMTRKELNQAIPPVYSRYIAEQFLAVTP